MLPVEKKADWSRKRKKREGRKSERVRGRYFVVVGVDAAGGFSLWDSVEERS